MLHNRQVLLLKVEGTYGVDAAPAAAVDAILVENLSVADSNLKMVQRPAIEASLGTRPHLFAGRLKEISFDMELKGSGVAGTAPECGPSLRGCGMGETIVPATSVQYLPSSTGHSSVTIWRYLDGRLEKFVGCRGNADFDFTTASKAMASFSFIGHWSTALDSAVVAPTYDTSFPTPLVGGAFSVSGYAAIINSLKFTLGNTIAAAPDFNGADGFGQVRITKRDVNGSFDPEDVLIATNDFDSHFRSTTTRTLATGTLGTAAGSRLAVSMPAIRYRARSENDRDGVQALDMGFGAATSAGDDEVSFLFT